MGVCEEKQEETKQEGTKHEKSKYRQGAGSNRTVFTGCDSRGFFVCVRPDTDKSGDRQCGGGEILKAAGVTYDNVVKTSCFLADIADFGAFNEVYAKYFTQNPARSCVAVKDLPKAVLCEVEVVAYLGK